MYSDIISYYPYSSLACINFHSYHPFKCYGFCASTKFDRENIFVLFPLMFLYSRTMAGFPGIAFEAFSLSDSDSFSMIMSASNLFFKYV